MMTMFFGLSLIVLVPLVEFISWSISKKICKVKEALGFSWEPKSILTSLLNIKHREVQFRHTYPPRFCIYLYLYLLVWFIFTLAITSNLLLHVVMLLGVPGVWIVCRKVVNWVSYPFTDSRLKRKVLRNDPELRRAFMERNARNYEDELVRYCNQLDKIKEIQVNDVNEFELDGVLYKLVRK